MNAPQSPLQTELGHALGSSLLADAMLTWHPASQTEQRVLVDELLSHAKSSANILTNILEHRAMTLDNGGGEDICDAEDVWGLADLTATLIEIVSVVSRRRYPERVEEPEPTTTCVWLSGGDGQELCTETEVRHG